MSKAGVEGTADKALVAQLATTPVSLGVVSAASGLIGLIPGMPLLPFAALSLGAGFMAWRLGRNRLKPQPTEGELAAAAARLQPAVERGAGAADVQVTGGAGRETGATGHGCGRVGNGNAPAGGRREGR